MTLFKTEKKRNKEVPPLLHSPLIEAIFELRWEILHEKETNRSRDPSYPILYGGLYERLKKELPLIEDLPSLQVHPETAPYVPRHRLRKDKEGYPLVQVGPGVVTVNEGKGYSWSSFSNLILKVVGSVIDLYPQGASPLNFMKVELRYVNAVPFDLGKEDPLLFLGEKMHLKLELDQELFELNPIHHRPNGVGLNLSYALDKPMGHLSLNVNLGQFEGKPAFIQQTVIHSFGDLTPSDGKTFQLWLEEGHLVAENCFHLFYKGKLMEQFCSEKEPKGHTWR